MSTNYYLHEKPPCPCCGREYEARHIGNSAAGWNFALHVYPAEGINDLPDWVRLWANGVIKDEYGRVVTQHEMWHIIAGRHKGLRRHTGATWQVDKIRPGAGTWDCLDFDFS